MEKNNVINAIRSVPIYTSIYTANRSLSMDTFHYHSGYEIYYISSGAVTFYVADKIYSLKKGNILIIPPYVLHRSEYPENLQSYRVEIVLSLTVIKEFQKNILNKLSDDAVLHIPSNQQSELLAVMKNIHHEVVHRSEYSEQLLEAYISELLIAFTRCRKKVAEAMVYDSTMESTIKEVVKYINENYSGQLSKKEIADRFGLSESSLLRNFQKYTGLGIKEYIISTRISNAEKKIVETELSITEIAYLCGFNDSNYFSTAFKNFNSMTPYKYRKQFACK